MPVTLPEVAEAQPLAGTQDLIINITSTGEYFVAKQQFSEGQLAALLAETHLKNPQMPVLIRGDGRAHWEHGVRVMGLCNKAKIKDYRVAALTDN